MKVFSLVAHWLGKQFLTLVVIVCVLAVGSYFYAEVREYIGLVNAYAEAGKTQREFPNNFKNLADDAAKRVSALGNASKEAVDRRIVAIDKELADLKSKRRSALKRKAAYLKGEFGDIKLDLRIDMLVQERNYLDKVMVLANSKARLPSLRRAQKIAQDDLDKNLKDQANLKAEHPFAIYNPLTQSYWDLKLLRNEYKDLKKRLDASNEALADAERTIQALEKMGPFRPTDDAYKKAKSTLDDCIDEIKKRLEESRINWLFTSVGEVLPVALCVLLGAILTPLGIKGFFFYVLAPLASRRSPICIAPESQGALMVPLEPAGQGGHVSARALEVKVSSREELLLHPEFLRSVAHGPRKSTKWVLDRQFPLSSLASGLFMLTYIEAGQEYSCTVASIEDPLLEVALIEIPEGTQLVLQPRHVVGVIQSCDRPLRISSHWRLKSVTAWMTLQLRYLTFAGPAKILVKGCQGVRVDDSGTGQSLNQASTIGFTANLFYAVRRCDPFVAYVRGKQELFDDSFSGPAGFYISEVTPFVGKKSGITGKGLEGIVDSLLKVVGL